MGPVEVEVDIDAANVGGPECERKRLIGLELEGALGVLAKAVERGAPLGEGGGELDVLVLEDEEVVGFGGCVEDDVV